MSQPITVQVVVTEPPPITVQVGVQGPPGPPGSAGVTGLVATAPLGAHRLVVADGAGGVVYADCTDLAHLTGVLGMTAQAVVLGGEIPIVRDAWLAEPTWTWLPGQPVYLGLAGVPTQTLPAEARFSLVVGFPVSATQLFVALREPVILT